MKHVNTVIIGAGQSGLAVSHELTKRGIDHVILERGQIANSWRQERWDSLRLLSPNRMNNLAGHAYDGPDPDGFMPVSELIARFNHCARRNAAPVQTETTVLSINKTGGGYSVQTDQGSIDCANIFLASGTCTRPKIPAFASEIPGAIKQFTPHSYKRPFDLPDGKVLVVGASASGQQLAREIQASGRQTTLAVGNHLRFPRQYRGVDIIRWMEAIKVTTTSYTEVDDIERARRTPSLTLVANETIDLNVLQDEGIGITGRLALIREGAAMFSGGLANLCAAADLKMNRLLSAINEWVENTGMDGKSASPERFPATRVPADPRLKIDLVKEGFGSVLWATGYQPDFSWLNLPVFDHKGRLRHEGGIVGNGVYAMGLPYMRQRKSTFIDGAPDDAAALVAHLSARLDQGMAA